MKMAIKIKIGAANEVDTKVSLEIRKTTDGDLLIFDHEDIDIVISANKGKVISFAKDIMDDKVYSTQNRLMKHLSRKGLIDQSTVRSGNIYGSIEAKILPAGQEDTNPVDLTLLSIGRWMEDERPYFVYLKATEEREVDRLLEPDQEDSTELGEVPQEDRKGSLGVGSYHLGIGTARSQIPYVAEGKKK
jgi:hypothetical protein